ncbi:TKL family protein kinase [Trichomonas vaginalis G3]|uniref:TKL family protein kinase n=1 Tax=Trichomonas vaginalis (strain ATCC PRA-98 / G3) TaxID=412133 RepID=A2DHW6_TRIV3|nr:protein kinase protein [Trichomonas vaginalis G3]EAY19955.1 TKL family protein kinase [Trichomonas vaginalis G3]KAI5525905.1 protein kinase protein [Trichomonas vaginalis G3]|eukprot:XP_001580941.1 TKL family protein kinase [Trichomonas vaginalis G3]
MTINTPLIQWVPQIKVDIHQILVMYRKVVVHRCKIACICAELQKFRSNVMNRVRPGQIASPKEHGEIQKLISHIKGMYGLVQSLCEDQYINTVLHKSPREILQHLREFRMNFNALTVSLKLANKDPLPLNQAQEAIDDLADLQDIVERLKFMKNENLLQESNSVLYAKRLEELEGIVREYQNDEEESNQSLREKTRILTQEEINDKVKFLEPWIYKQFDFDLKKVIGHGAFADVYWSYQVSDNMNNRIVAVKKMKAAHFTQYSLEMFMREITIFSKMNHPAILPFVGVTITPPFYIVTEFMEGGCLYNRLHDNQPLRDPTKLTIIAIGVAHAMKYLHSQGIVHRDLKSLNVLLDANDFPKVCDFGMSRTLPENGELMSGSVGTVQWMAPEVLKSERYTEKADVYSYGVLLWELLTGDSPFKKMRDVQVTIAVLSSNARPMMPPNPSRISKLIKICWDTDPDKRPDFETIAKILESGELDFPGARREDIEAYINLLNEQDTSSVKIDINTPSQETAQDIVDKFSDPEKCLDSILKAESLFDEENWTQLFLNANIAEKIHESLTKCEDARVANVLFQLIAKCFRNNEFLHKFIDLQPVEALIEVVRHLSSTSMSYCVEVLTPLLKLNLLKLNGEVITKISAFLVTSQINQRKLTADFLKEMIDRKCYEEEASLANPVHNCLVNAMPETEGNLLFSIISLLEKLSTFKSAAEAIRSSVDGFKRLLELCKVSNEEIAYLSLVVVRRLSEELSSPNSDDKIKLFCGVFPSIVLRSSRFTNLSLTTLALSGRSVNGPKIIANCRECLSSLQKCLEINDEITTLISLKLLSTMFYFRSVFGMIEFLAKYIKPKYSHPSKNVRKLTAVCLSIFMKNATEDWTELIGEGLVEFIKGLFKEEDLLIDALKLCGVFSTKFDGSRLLSKSGIVQDIVNVLNKDDERLQELSCIVLASYSSQFPFSTPALDAIETILTFVEKDFAAPSSLIFIANVAINKQASIKIAKRVGILLKMIEEKRDNETIIRVLVALQRISANTEAAEIIIKENEKLFVLMSDLFGTSFEGYSYTIINSLSLISCAKEIVSKTQIPSLVYEKIRQMELTDPLRPQILNLVSRLVF